jgi:hypothetical protein
MYFLGRCRFSVKTAERAGVRLPAGTRAFSLPFLLFFSGIKKLFYKYHL